MQNKTNELESLRYSFAKFIDDVVFQTIRYPQLPLPQNRDEVMQNVNLSYLQEYIYA